MSVPKGYACCVMVSYCDISTYIFSHESHFHKKQTDVQSNSTKIWVILGTICDAKNKLKLNIETVLLCFRYL